MKFKHLLFLAAGIIFNLYACKQKDKPTMKTKQHSYSNFEDINLKHISLNLKVNFGTKTLSGKVVLSLNNKNGVEQLILDHRDMKIHKILLEDKIETTFKTSQSEDKVFGAPLIIDIEKNTEKVAVYYTTKPSSAAVMWLGKEQTNDGTDSFLFTQSQAILARSWIPLMDLPAIRFTYDANIETSKGLMALMSAENSPVQKENNIYSFEMKQPIPSYLMALTVGKLEFKSLGNNCGVYAEPGMIKKSAYEFADLSKMISSAENLYGPYLWGRYDIVVLPPSFPFGGMENPRLTFATPTIIAGDRSLVSLVAHELAHSWSGNLVTNKTWDDFWLNEGFTVYFESRIMEAIYGKEYDEMQTELGMGEMRKTVEELMKTAPNDTKLKLDLEGRDPDDGMTDIAYEKGRAFLMMLEQKVGRKKWDAFVTQYFKENAFKTTNTEYFVEYLTKHLFDGDVSGVNINEWIYETGLPNNCPTVVSTELKKVEEDAAIFAKQMTLPNSQGYTTHHWLHFFRILQGKINAKHLEALDQKYDFTNSTNCEIQCDWYQHCIELDYEKANPKIKEFLTTVGRRKFLTPLYSRLVKTKKGKAFANEIFEIAEPGYHQVSTVTISKMLED